MLHFSQNKIIYFYNMSSQELHCKSKLRTASFCDYVRVVPALSMEKLKHRQDVLSQVSREARNGGQMN